MSRSPVVIRAQGLSKWYRLGEREPYKSLRETLSRGVGRIFRPRDPLQARHIWALRDVSFEVGAGEVLGVIGHNGAGKSTLLKLLSRITEPTTGRAEIVGRVGSLLEVGTGFHPELTGRENIFLNGAILGMKRAEVSAKFDAIVAFAEVEPFIDTPVKRYSSGMYLRLAFAVAAHMEPEILLVDEVLAVGDVAFQKKCLGKMNAVSHDGRTVLVVSHNMPIIMNLCSRVLLLQRGGVVRDGSPSDVVQHYLSETRTQGGDITWENPDDAPGDDVARLHAVRILQPGIDGPTADVDISKDVLIEISYWCRSAGALLYPSVWLRDKLGAVVFAGSSAPSSNLNEDSWYGRPHPVGLYRARCCIPGNMLNDGMYSVTAVVAKLHNTILVKEDMVLSFFVHDTGEMRGEYYGEWIGAIRPRLAWTTERLE